MNFRGLFRILCTAIFKKIITIELLIVFKGNLIPFELISLYKFLNTSFNISVNLI